MLSILMFAMSCEKKETDINQENHLKNGKAFVLINGTTFTNGLITFEYSDMIKHSMDYLQAKKFQTFLPEVQREMFVESVLDFLRNVCLLDENEIVLYEQSVWNNVNQIENQTLRSCSELSEQQVTIAEEILTITQKSTTTDLRENLEPIRQKINLLPEQERVVLNNALALLLTASDVVGAEIEDKSFWGSFICNALCSGVGAIYGGAVGALCPPAGIAVGIMVSSGLSAAVC
jgi:hypothetical protein